MTSPIENNRLDYLDAVRSFALLLGIVFHASLSFLPMFIGWAVMDVSTSSFVSIFILVSHSFRMELFFLIAGFFSHMVYHSKGASVFIKSRLKRIAIPFVVGWFILRPLLVSGWVIGSASMRGDADILAGLKFGFQSLGEFPKDFLTGSHLWFLYYLLLVTAITLVLRFLTTMSSAVHDGLTGSLDTVVSWIANSRFALVAVSIPTAASLWFMNNWGMVTPDTSLVPNVPVTLIYGGFFFLGWLLHRQKSLIERLADLSVGRSALCVASIVTTIFLSEYQSDTGNSNFALIHAGYSLSYAIMMWTLVVLSIGLFKRFCNKPSRIVRYIADASYWLYLLHLPIVIWLQIAFAELSLHWSIKLVSISLLTIGLSLIVYDLFVRSTFIGNVLNGRKKDRVLFGMKKLKS